MLLSNWWMNYRRTKRAVENKCSICGYKFLDTHDARGNGLIGVFLAKRAFICQKCGYLYCLKCAHRKSEGVLVCHCGESLTMRI